MRRTELSSVFQMKCHQVSCSRVFTTGTYTCFSNDNDGVTQAKYYGMSIRMKITSQSLSEQIDKHEISMTTTNTGRDSIFLMTKTMISVVSVYLQMKYQPKLQSNCNTSFDEEELPLKRFFLN